MCGSHLDPEPLCKMNMNVHESDDVFVSRCTATPVNAKHRGVFRTLRHLQQAKN